MEDSELKYFVYQDKQYPFNFELMKTYSNYFFRKQKDFQKIEYIKFNNSYIAIPRFSFDILKLFIYYCQKKQIQLDNSNIIPLYFLSEYYEVLTLKNEAETYIKDHHKELIDDFFTNFQELKHYNQKAYEFILSKNFTNYSNDDRLFCLSVSSLYRIISQYHLQSTNTEENEEIVINFIFKYYEQNGPSSIVLLDLISFEKVSPTFLNQKLREHPSLYSFLFIHMNIIRSTFEVNQHLIQKEIEMSNSIKNLNDEIQLMKENYDDMSFEMVVKNQNSKIVNFLMYLKEKIGFKFSMKNNFEGVFLPDRNETLVEILKKNMDVNKIGINSIVIEKIFFSRLNFNEFMNNVLKFSEFTFELNDSTQFFAAIYAFIYNIKQEYQKNKLNVSIVVEKNNFSEIIDINKIVNEILIKPTITKIKDRNFANFKLLNKISFPSTILSLGTYSFHNCSSLTEIIIPNSVIEIKQSAFRNCSALIKINLPSSLKTIEKNAFGYCSLLKTIEIPSSIKTIEKLTFEMCSSLTQVILHNGLESIQDEAFFGCKSLNQISFPDSLKKIGSRAFFSCSSLKKLIIPQSVFYIGQKAFEYCNSLDQITIPEMISMSFININSDKVKVIKQKIDANILYDYGKLLLSIDELKENKKEAYRYFELSGSKGNVKAFTFLGDLFLNSNEKNSLQMAQKYYQIAADHDDAYSNFKLAHFLFYNKHMISAGINNYKKAIELGSTEAMIEFGEILIHGINIDVNTKEGIEYIKNAIDKGSIEAMQFYGAEINKIESLKFIEKEANKGNIKAQNHFANILYNGDSLPLNKEESLKFYKKAADKGYKNSIFNYALMMIQGDGIPFDKQKAIEYLKKIFSINIDYDQFLSFENNNISIEELKEQIKKGDCDAMYKYASIFEHGSGVPIDKKEALIYYRQAAFKGNSDAMNKYATMLLNGDGIQSNRKEAIKYYKIAIEKGNIDAMNNLANILINEDKEKEEEEAISYYKIGIEKGNSDCMNSYAKLLENEGEEDKAVELYQEAINKNNSDAMLNYALMLLNKYKNNSNIDINQIISLIQMSIIKNNEKAMLVYARLLYNGDLFSVDKEEAFKFFKMAADRGNNEAIYQVIKMLDTSDYISINKEEIFKYIKIEADKGNMDPVYDFIINLYDKEKGAISRDEMLQYYKILALNGNSNLMNSLAIRLHKGDGISSPKEEPENIKNIANKNNIKIVLNNKDLMAFLSSKESKTDEAIKLFKVAADKGNNDSMFYLADTLINEVEIEKKEGIHYLKLSADKGNVDAMFRYAVMLQYGENIEVNKKEAIKYYKMASEYGNARAMCNYARMLFDGDGVEVNKKEAKEIYQMAANEGDSYAHYLLTKLNFNQ